MRIYTAPGDTENMLEFDASGCNALPDGGKPTVPIEKLKVYGNQVSMPPTGKPVAPPSSPSVVLQQETYEVQSITSSVKTPSTLRRYEFIRRSLTRAEKNDSPTFMIEGKKVRSRSHVSDEKSNPASEDLYAERQPSETRSVKNFRGFLPRKTTETVHSSARVSHYTSTTSVVLPILHIEGPGFTHQLRSKSTSLPDDNQPSEMDDQAPDATTAPTESICSEMDTEKRNVKKNNFFMPVMRAGEDFHDLCIENSATNRSKTISLDLQTEHPKPNAPILLGPKLSKSPRERHNAMRGALLSKNRPTFNSIESYMNYNKRMYSSEQFIDTHQTDNVILRSTENRKSAFPKRLIAKYSDIAVHKELSDYMKIKPVNSSKGL